MGSCVRTSAIRISQEVGDWLGQLLINGQIVHVGTETHFSGFQTNQD